MPNNTAHIACLHRIFHYPAILGKISEWDDAIFGILGDLSHTQIPLVRIEHTIFEPMPPVYVPTMATMDDALMSWAPYMPLGVTSWDPLWMEMGNPLIPPTPSWSLCVKLSTSIRVVLGLTKIVHHNPFILSNLSVLDMKYMCYKRLLICQTLMNNGYFVIYC
jgi:hypothetical protein